MRDATKLEEACLKEWRTSFWCLSLRGQLQQEERRVHAIRTSTLQYTRNPRIRNSFLRMRRLCPTSHPQHSSPKSKSPRWQNDSERGKQEAAAQSWSFGAGCIQQEENEGESFCLLSEFSIWEETVWVTQIPGTY